MQITIIGLDLAKHWFQVHGVDAYGQVVVRRRLWRSGEIGRASCRWSTMVIVAAPAVGDHHQNEC